MNCGFTMTKACGCSLKTRKADTKVSANAGDESAESSVRTTVLTPLQKYTFFNIRTQSCFFCEKNESVNMVQPLGTKVTTKIREPQFTVYGLRFTVYSLQFMVSSPLNNPLTL